jgi:hypothetical protein
MFPILSGLPGQVHIRFASSLPLTLAKRVPDVPPYEPALSWYEIELYRSARV